jgi:hypothetical protein
VNDKNDKNDLEKKEINLVGNKKNVFSNIKKMKSIVMKFTGVNF